VGTSSHESQQPPAALYRVPKGSEGLGSGIAPIAAIHGGYTRLCLVRRVRRRMIGPQVRVERAAKTDDTQGALEAAALDPAS